MAWSDNESAMVEKLVATQKPLADLQPTAEELCQWDCENKKYIVELKFRPGNVQYEDAMIEQKKYEALIEAGEATKRDALYVMQSVGKIYIWNLTRLTAEGYDFHWYNKSLRATTHFVNRGYVKKRIGRLQWEDAKVIIDVR